MEEGGHILRASSPATAIAAIMSERHLRWLKGRGVDIAHSPGISFVIFRRLLFPVELLSAGHKHLSGRHLLTHGRGEERTIE